MRPTVIYFPCIKIRSVRLANIHNVLWSTFWALFLAQGVSSTYTCSSCTCIQISADRVFADCSNRNLTSVPDDLPTDTYCLDLSSNQIQEINTAAKPFAQLHNLSSISLSRNLLHKLERNDLKDVKQLEKLDLSLNQIRYKRIADDAFDLVPNLVYLDIKQSFQDLNPEESFHVQALGQLKKLRSLMIDIANMEKLGDEFTHLTNLEELYLSGTYGRCNIPEICEVFFDKIKLPNFGNKQFHLYLSNCGIETIEKNALMPLKHLTTLDLSWNQNLTFAPLANVTEDLADFHGNFIRFLNLNSIYKYFELNKCNEMQTTFMKPLYNTSLEILSIESNNIVNMDLETIKHFPKNLKYFSIRDNMFLYGNYVKYAIMHGSLDNLLYYDTAAMFKSHIPPKISVHHDQGMYEQNDCTDKCKSTNTYRNSFLEPCQECCDAMFTRNQEYDFARVILNRVHSLQNKDNKTEEQKQLMTPHKHHNGAVSQKDQQRNGSQLVYLDVSENLPGAVNISIELFPNLRQLLYLNMSLNMYGYTYFSQDNASLFEATEQLKVLDLSSNRVLDIWYDAFRPLKHLEQLYLSNNQLRGVNFAIDHMQKLTYVDLSNNRMEKVDKRARDVFNKLQKVAIKLSNNMLKCSCSDVDFIDWIKTNTSVHFIDFNSYKCSFDNWTNVLVKDVDLSILRNDCFPEAYTYLIVLISILFNTFLLILATKTMYRYKRNLLYLYYMTKCRIFEGFVPDEADQDFRKDIFVIYSSEDRDFVLNEARPKLEANRNVTLLLHDCDFKSNLTTMSNIFKALSGTQRVLAILTRHFVSSTWCKRELLMALFDSAENDKPLPCVVCIEYIPFDMLYSELQDIIRENAYLDYPQTVAQQQQFWNDLREDLRVHR